MSIKVTDQTQTLANYLRSDKLFASKNISDSKLRKLLTGLAVEVGRLEGTIDDVTYGFFPNNANGKLLENWESALGIPDDCFFLSATKAQRVRNVLAKLTAMGVSTKTGFEALALTFGISVNVVPGAIGAAFPLLFPIALHNSIPRWTMIVEAPAASRLNVFPLSFPIPFLSNDDTSIIVCLFQKLAPEFIKVIFKWI